MDANLTLRARSAAHMSASSWVSTAPMVVLRMPADRLRFTLALAISRIVSCAGATTVSLIMPHTSSEMANFLLKGAGASEVDEEDEDGDLVGMESSEVVTREIPHWVLGRRSARVRG